MEQILDWVEVKGLEQEESVPEKVVYHGGRQDNGLCL